MFWCSDVLMSLRLIKLILCLLRSSSCFLPYCLRTGCPFNQSIDDLRVPTRTQLSPSLEHDELILIVLIENQLSYLPQSCAGRY